MQLSQTEKEVKKKAEKLCVLREYSPFSIQNKLMKWGIEKSVGAKIVLELIKENFINEQRFADAYCKDKFKLNDWGKQKIKQMLQNHFLSEKVIEQALVAIDNEKYEQKIVQLAEKKWQSLKSKNTILEKKDKTANYLFNKGYETDLILETIHKLEENAPFTV